MNRGFRGVYCGLMVPVFVALISVSAGIFNPAAAQSADGPVGARPEGPVASPDIRPAVVMCCGRGARRWRTNIQACRREGGRPLPEIACRGERRMCCRRGKGYFLATARMCRGAGRTVAAMKVCTEPGERVCCMRRRGYPRLAFDTRRACDKAGGRLVAFAQCRGGPDNRAGRVCCMRSNSSSWMLYRNCGPAGGRVVDESVCEARDRRREAAVCCRLPDGRHSPAREETCRKQRGTVVGLSFCRGRGGTVRRR